MSSYHGASSHREDLVHGLILVYSANRKASFAALKAFSSNVPNLPIQIIAVTENGGAASAMFGSTLGQKMITDGNALADELRAHFATWSGEHTMGIYTPFFRQVWDQKTDIEKAFRMESPPLYRAPPAPAPRPGPGEGPATNNDSDDIYEQLPSGDSEGEGGSEDALVKPSWIRQRQGPPVVGAPPFGKGGPGGKMDAGPGSDNFVMKEFDNLWAGARRSHRETGAGVVGGLGGGMIPGGKGQPYLAFTTGRRGQLPSSRNSAVNNNGMGTQLRSHGSAGHGTNIGVGRINMAEYSAVTDALSRMRLPRTSPPYSNLPNEDYVSDTGHRNRTNRSRRNTGRLPPPPSDSSSSASPVSDPEDLRPSRHKKKAVKNTSVRSRQVPNAGTGGSSGKQGGNKAIFTPIPTVPKGFVPYQLSADSGIFSGSRNKSLTMEEGSEASSPVDQEKKPFSRAAKEPEVKEKTKEKSRKKEKPPKKLTKSKSTEQQPQTTPTFGTSVSKL